MDEAQAAVFAENVQNICQLIERLSDLGVESVFQSVNLLDDSSFYLGSSVGKRFMLEKSDIIDSFHTFCGKYARRPRLSKNDLSEAKTEIQNVDDINVLSFEKCVTLIGEHIEKLALISVNSVFLSVNMTENSMFQHASPLGMAFMSERKDIIDLFSKYCDDNSLLSKNQEEKERTARELMCHVQAICEHIQELSNLGEETVFLSVNMKNETSFYSGSNGGKMFINFKSNVMDTFYQYCKDFNFFFVPVHSGFVTGSTGITATDQKLIKPVLPVFIQAGQNPSLVLRKDMSTQTDDGLFAKTENLDIDNVAVSTTSSCTTHVDSRNFSTKRSRAVEENEKSIGTGKNICSIKRIKKEPDITDEMNHAEKFKMLKCNTCSLYFTNVKDLDNHEKCHEIVDMYHCDKCGTNIYNKESFKIHMGLHAQGTWNLQSSEKNPSIPSTVSKSENDPKDRKPLKVRVSLDVLKAFNLSVGYTNSANISEHVPHIKEEIDPLKMTPICEQTSSSTIPK